MTGPVNLHYIWYGNWTGNGAVGILTTFGKNLGGSPYYNINTTYTDGAGNHITNAINFGASTTDNYSQGTALSDSAIQAVVLNAISSGRLPLDQYGIYLVLTSADVTATSGFCTQYCGWHTHTTSGTTHIKYAFVGDPTRCPSACQQQVEQIDVDCFDLAGIVVPDDDALAILDALNGVFARGGQQFVRFQLCFNPAARGEVFEGVFDGFFNHLLHGSIVNVHRGFHFDDFLFAGGDVAGEDVENAVRVDFKLHADARDVAWQKKAP